MTMQRTQIYLTLRQRRELQRLADQQHTTMAGVLREAVDAYIVRFDADRDPLLDVIGIAHGDATDAAEDHDRYLYEPDSA
jgi:hypothetical protein